MKLEPIIQNEVSHKEKHQYSLLTHIYGIYKDDPICEIGWWSYMWDSKRDTDVKNRLLNYVGEGKGGIIWENSIERCILPYVKWIISPSWMHELGNSKLVHWDNPEGWDGEEGGKGVQDGGHMYTHSWFMSMYGKNYHNIVE